MSDIRKYAVSPTSRLHLKNAVDELMYADDNEAGKPDLNKPMVVVLWGPGSREHARAQAIQSNRFMEKLRGKGRINETEAERREQQAEMLAACTQSFENIDYANLQGLALYKAVYSDLEIGFIADQVAKHLGDWANFQKTSTPS